MRNIPKDTPLLVVRHFFNQMGGIVRNCTSHEDKAVGHNGLSIVVRLNFDKKVNAENVMALVQQMTTNPFSVFRKAPGDAPLLIAKYAQVFSPEERQSYRETIAAKRTSNPFFGDTTAGSSRRNNTTTTSLDSSSSSKVAPTTPPSGLMPPAFFHPSQPPVMNPSAAPPQMLNIVPLTPVPNSADAQFTCLPLPPSAITAGGGLAAAAKMILSSMPMPMSMPTMPADPPMYTESS